MSVRVCVCVHTIETELERKRNLISTVCLNKFHNLLVPSSLQRQCLLNAEKCCVLQWSGHVVCCRLCLLTYARNIVNISYVFMIYRKSRCSLQFKHKLRFSIPPPHNLLGLISLWNLGQFLTICRNLLPSFIWFSVIPVCLRRFSHFVEPLRFCRLRLHKIPTFLSQTVRKSVFRHSCARRKSFS